MGFFSAPKPQAIQPQEVAPAPPAREPEPVDPAGLDQARKRAKQAEARNSRKRLIIPLGGTESNLGSGLQII